MDAQELLHLRLEAMRAVLRADSGYTLRSIRRWYSEKFSTPLHLVGTDVDTAVPLEDVLQHFYENRYANMADKDREHEVADLLMTPEELRDVGALQDREEVESWHFAKAVAARDLEKQRRAAETKAAPAPTQARDLPMVPSSSAAAAQRLQRQGVVPEASLEDATQLMPPQPPVVTTSSPPAAFESKLPEDVHVEFVVDDDLEGIDPFSLEKGQSKK